MAARTADYGRTLNGIARATQECYPGLGQHDRILMVNNVEVTDETVLQAIQEAKLMGSVMIRFQRRDVFPDAKNDYNEDELSVPDDVELNYVTIEFPADRKLGCSVKHQMVSNVKVDTTAFDEGVRVGWTCVGVNGHFVNDQDHLSSLLKEAKKSKKPITVMFEVPVSDDAELAECTCPITTELFVDPVTIADGSTFERANIEEWLKKKDTSPLTNLNLKHKQLTPNTKMKQMCDQIRRRLRQSMSKEAEPEKRGIDV